MQLEVVFRKAATRDLNALYDYIAAESPRRADAFIGRIRSHCEGLGHIPELGRLRPELGPRLRSIAIERRVVILYVVATRRIEIARVFYRGRDIQALMHGRT